MIRFIDLSESYDPHNEPVPRCAFLHTITNRFIRNGDDTNVFLSMEEVQDTDERLCRLVPKIFFNKKNKTEIMYAIGVVGIEGFSHGPFPSLKMALETDGDVGDCIFILDGKSKTPMLGWDGKEWVPVFSR